MPVRKDSSGNRSVEAEVEVPGRVEDVWKAIATGPGISSWFVPSTCDERVGGMATSNFGPGMEAVATIKEWNPPHNFVAEAPEGPGNVATEWIVEARDGGTCTVRVVHRWFSSTDDWDDQFEGHTYGWQGFFRILRLYLAHFNGQPCTARQFMGFSTRPLSETWQSLIESLGISTASQIQTRPSAPTLAGTVERRSDDAHPELLVRLTAPAPGIAHLFAMSMGGQVLVSIRLYLYGDQAASVAPQAEMQWNTWLTEQFPPPAMPVGECVPDATCGAGTSEQ